MGFIPRNLSKDNEVLSLIRDIREFYLSVCDWWSPLEKEKDPNKNSFEQIIQYVFILQSLKKLFWKLFENCLKIVLKIVLNK